MFYPNLDIAPDLREEDTFVGEGHGTCPFIVPRLCVKTCREGGGGDLGGKGGVFF